MKNKMSFDQARKVPILLYLETIKHYPRRITTKGIYWYCSPLREENTPSFKVDTRLNLWYDFGVGLGGNIIDLVVKLNNFINSSDALSAISFLSFQIPNNPINIGSYISAVTELQNSTNIEIKKVRNLGFNNAIRDYVNSRKLDFELARNYLQELYYCINQKHYFSAGFKNNSNGWEIRNKYFKGCLGSKDITSIIKKRDGISVFEGFTDFLSALQMQLALVKQTDILVLNSNSLVEKGIRFLKDYEKVDLFLDNDNSGDVTTKRIMEAIPLSLDKRFLYKGHKDVNELLAINAVNSQKAY